MNLLTFRYRLGEGSGEMLADCLLKTICNNYLCTTAIVDGGFFQYFLRDFYKIAYY